MRNSSLYIAVCLFGMLLLAGCTSPASENTSVVPAVVELSVEAQPSVLPADGISRMVVFVEMREGDRAVDDSTEIILLNSKGTLLRGVIYTRGGVALDTLTADTSAGTGWLIAYATGLRDSVEIMFTTLE